ncbi:MAG: hypothetical protein Q9182_003415 [Xanthomendoza sp. 2 TL-2023]
MSRSPMPANFGDHEQKANDSSSTEHRADAEKAVGRNPHPNFQKVQAARPDWRQEESWHCTKIVDPNWKLGQGANDDGESLNKKHVEIDPYEAGRPAVFNYKLLISAIIPRPIGFVSTRSEDDATSINAPHGISEWALSGLTPAACTDVKCSRVKEAIFSVEGKLFSTQEFESRATPGKKTGVLAIVEGTRFWVREDALNEDRNLVDPSSKALLSQPGHF